MPLTDDLKKDLPVKGLEIKGPWKVRRLFTSIPSSTARFVTGLSRNLYDLLLFIMVIAMIDFVKDGISLTIPFVIFLFLLVFVSLAERRKENLKEKTETHIQPTNTQYNSKKDA